MEDRQRILIIDDDENARKSLSLIFEKKGYATETAGTGQEALAQARDGLCDLALIDVKLPDVEGTELLAPLRKMHPDLVLILVTGHASVENVVQAMSEGASAYVTKPLNIDTLLVTIGEALEKQRLVLENRRLYEAAQRELAERKQAEFRLRETERRFRTLLDNVRLVAVGLDREGNVSYANPYLLELVGHTMDQVLGEPWFEVFVPDGTRPEAQAAFAELLEDESRSHYQGSILTRDGEERLIAWNRTLLLDENGAAEGTMSIGEDITDRVRAERALEQRAAQLALLNDIGRQIAAELDLQSVLDLAAHLVQERFGYHHVALFTVDRERGDLLMNAQAGSTTTLFPPGHRLKLGEGMVGWAGDRGKRLLSNDVRTEPRYVNPYPSQVLTLSELSVPIRVGQEIVGVLDVQSPQRDAFDDNDVIVMETLTDQIAVAIHNSRLYSQAQQRLDELAFHNAASQALVSSLDLERVMETTMHHATEVLQMEAGSVLLLDPETGDLVFGAASGGGADELPGQRLPAGQGVGGWVAQHGESLVVADVRADPRFYPRFDSMSDFSTHSILCVPLIYRDHVIGVIQALNKIDGEFTAQDQRLLEALAPTVAIAIENARLYQQVQAELSERVRAEEALRQERASLAQRVLERTAELSMANAELARAARLKDEFMAAMSHELRTPLNAVLGLSEALQEEVYGPLNDRQMRSLSRIEESGQHLLELINEILDISKIEAGKLELQVHPVAVESICQASLRLVKQMAQKKQLKLSLAYDSNVVMIEADGRRLKQILVNLLTNAVKFTPEGGEISLKVAGDPEREAVHFFVRDTGIGISEEGMGRLFQPFVQLDSSLSRRYDGTGLGLALVSRLTELLGGGVSVESVFGEGSCFTVSLPWRGALPDAGPNAADSSARVPRPAVASPREGSQPLVLLAEDHEANITTFQEYLLIKGYRVIVARNGGEAVRRAREEMPDMILMDIQMPEVDGLEAIRIIRADASISNVPIIALTALAMPGDRERCMTAGASDYLSKPVSLRQLVTMIEAHLGTMEHA